MATPPPPPEPPAQPIAVPERYIEVRIQRHHARAGLVVLLLAVALFAAGWIGFCIGRHHDNHHWRYRCAQVAVPEQSWKLCALPGQINPGGPMIPSPQPYPLPQPGASGSSSGSKPNWGGGQIKPVSPAPVAPSSGR